MSDPIVHEGPARHTVTLSDGSVWTWKADHWLSGADAGWLERPEPFRYIDGQPMTDADKQAAARVRERREAEDA